MRQILALLPCIALTLTAVACAQDGPLVPDGAQVEEVATGFKFTEGPAEGPDGAIYFSDIPNRKVHRYDPETGETTVFLEDSGGSNGLAFDAQGRLVLAADRDRKVTRLEEDGSITVLADSYEGNKLNSPNDLVIDEQGGIYFTDPRYGNGDNRELDFEGLFYLQPETGDLTLLDKEFRKPNGVALSPDGNTLYVADWAGQKVLAYNVTSPGRIADRRTFAETPFEKAWHGPDGMATDAAGRLYVALPVGIRIFSPEGEKLAEIPTPGGASNATLAEDGQMLYTTANNNLYRIRLNAAK